MGKYEKLFGNISGFIGTFYKSILLSGLMLSTNILLLLFTLSFEGLFSVLGIAITFILSASILPSFCAMLYAIQRSDRMVKSYFNYFKLNGLLSMKIGLFLSLILVILGVDAFYFYSKGNIVLEFIFTGLSLCLFVILLNTSVILSFIQADFKKILLISLAYTKELVLSSIVAITLLLVPLIFMRFGGPLLYLTMIGMAGIGQIYASKNARETIKDTIEDSTVKYL